MSAGFGLKLLPLALVLIAQLSWPGPAAGEPCPKSTLELTAWRARLVKSLQLPYNSDTFGASAAEEISKCLQEIKPLLEQSKSENCMDRLQKFIHATSRAEHAPELRNADATGPDPCSHNAPVVSDEGWLSSGYKAAVNLLPDRLAEGLRPTAAPKAETPEEKKKDDLQLEVPDDLKDETFLRLVSDRNTMKEAKAYLDQLNQKKPDGQKYTYIQYTSQFVISPDESASPERLMVYVPGDKKSGYDRFVLFSVSNPYKPNIRPSMVSVVSVRKTDDQGQELSPKTVRFKTHWREYAPGNQISLHPLDHPLKSELNCYSCHKGGVNFVFPLEGSLAAGETDSWRKITDVVKGYGPQTFGDSIRPEEWGPSMGVDEKSPSAGSFAQCVNHSASLHSSGSVDPSKIISSANCTFCHDGPKSPGALNFPLGGLGSSGDQIHAYICDLKRMPPRKGYDLNSGDREILSQCLIEDYYGGLGNSAGPANGKLSRWLTELSCEK